MNREEKEQWLYETYNYTSNFDFKRLEKYEEANDDICIDDLILDYTMLYEFHKREIEKLKELVITLWHNNNTRFLNKEQINLLNNIVFGNDEDLGSDKD